MKYTITHAQMVAKLIKSGEKLKEEFTSNDCRLIHSTIGIVGELGELAGGIDYAIGTGTTLDHENIIEELGDLEFYLEDFRTIAQITRQETLECDIVCRVADGPLRRVIHMLIYGTDLMDQIKKAVIYRKRFNRDAVIINLSKIEFILEAFRQGLQITYEQTLESNMDKLAKRYDGFEYSDQRAHERADKPEEQGGNIVVPFHGIIKP